MTTEQIIDRAHAEGMTYEQIMAVVNHLFETNVYRVSRGYPPIDLEDAMPRYVEVK